MARRIVYQSFEGRFSDNPKAIHVLLREGAPDAEHLWLLDPAHAATFPPGLTTVEWGTPEGIEALETADVLVANTHTDVRWRKQPDALYLQTWHGTPLKRIHHDVLWAPEGRIERLSGDVAQWDVLLSPNAPSTPRMRQAFGYDGEVLESGYPRNDLLSAPGRDDVRARTRVDLDIADGVTAVLYTPTWRDQEVFTDSTAQVGLGLDVAAVAGALGDDHVLLVRAHYMLTGRLAGMDHPAIRDVSWHPEVAELYLAADAMVTDYSSTMFDFAITGKPMVFFVHDLDDFTSRVRGLYFDFIPDAPGPVVETTPDVIEALRDLPASVDGYADRYRRFRDTWCHLEDGRATERVVRRILG